LRACRLTDFEFWVLSLKRGWRTLLHSPFSDRYLEGQRLSGSPIKLKTQNPKLKTPRIEQEMSIQREAGRFALN
jgi:hypothetical protein